jgi:hypothetical protein
MLANKALTTVHGFSRENAWQDRATAAAIAAARRIVLGDDAVIPMMTPVSSLSDVEWGWIVAGVLFAWIAARGEQATVEGCDVEKAIRDGVEGAWDAGAIATILPTLADAPGIDWTKPLAGWPRDQMIAFLSKALSLAQHAMAARDRGPSITRKGADIVLTV